MTRILELIDTHPRPIVLSLTGVIVFFVTACSLHDTLPVCHYLFGCDHALHAATPMTP